MIKTTAETGSFEVSKTLIEKEQWDLEGLT
jgi:hypothetical protein